ncbi:MAG: OmpA family protein [Polyangiaceae bacterium]
MSALRAVGCAAALALLAACDPPPPAVAPAPSTPSVPRPRTEAGHPMPPLHSSSAPTFPLDADRCADTTDATRLPDRPCISADGKRIFAPALRFDLDKARLKQESQPVLDALAELLARYPALRLRIEGHLNDGDARPYSAKSLDRARAEVVMQALVNRAVDPARLTALGFGSSVPLYPPTSDEGKRYNRRIEFVIVPPAP